MTLSRLHPLLLLTTLLGSWACMKTTTTPPGSVTPPCATCTFGSFYVIDECGDEDGCQVIDPTPDILQQVVTPAGCREQTMTCPTGSFVISTSGTPPTTTDPISWTNFMAIFMDIVCGDAGMWQLYFQTGQSTPLTSIYCYYKKCTLCPDIPNTMCTATDGSCGNPQYQYSTPTPTPGATCRTVQITCPASTDPTKTVAMIQIILNNGDVVEFTEANLAASGLACSAQSTWTLMVQGQTQTINSAMCVYSA